MLAHDPKQTAKMTPYPPLATLYAAGALRAAGDDVALFDGTFEPGLARFEAMLAAHRPDVFVMIEDIYNFLSKMCLRHQRETAQRMCTLAKAAGARVIAAGPDCSDAPEVYLRSGADAVLIGEPDATLLEICEAWRTGRDKVPAIAGVAHLSGNRLVRTPARQNARDLDAVPFPAWDLVDAAAFG